MAPSFLRKRSRPRSGQSPISPSSNSVRPSLSLPDLTTPLIDQPSWEEVPHFVFTAKDRTRSPTSPISPTPTTTSRSKIDAPGAGSDNPKAATIPSTNKARNKTPSLVGGEGKVQFHRPFTPKMIISPLTPGSATSPPRSQGAGDKTDFRKSSAKWGREIVSAGPGGGFASNAAGAMTGGPMFSPPAFTSMSMNFGLSPTNLADGGAAPGLALSGGESNNAKKMRDSLMSMITRRKGRKTGVIGKLNIVVAGGKSVGKTSFVNMLLSSLNEVPLSNGSTLPTLKPKAYMALSTLSDRLLLRLIDTPGLDLALSDELKAKERERGVAGLLRMVEDRFEEVWREERKVRRQVGAEEGLVHLVLYLIDARQILHPQLPRLSDEVDWSCLGLFDDDEPGSAREALGRKSIGPTSNEPRISTVEIDIIKRLSARSNVLPILTHSDQLSVQELEKVKEALRRNLGSVKAGLPGKGFGVFGASDEESRKSFDSLAEGMDINERDTNNREAPPTPDSLHSDSLSEKLPYAIFTPDSISFASFRTPDFSAPPSIPPVPPIPESIASPLTSPSVPIVKAARAKTPVHVPRPLYPHSRAAARPKNGNNASGGAGGTGSANASVSGSVSGSIRSHKSTGSTASHVSERAEVKESLADAEEDDRANAAAAGDVNMRASTGSLKSESNALGIDTNVQTPRGPATTTSEVPDKADPPQDVNINTGPSREFAWGKGYINNPLHSDFAALREAILGDNARMLRNSTREVLYEKYRTEKLLSRRGTQLPEDERDRIVREIMKV